MVLIPDAKRADCIILTRPNRQRTNTRGIVVFYTRVVYNDRRHLRRKPSKRTGLVTNYYRIVSVLTLSDCVHDFQRSDIETDRFDDTTII